MISRPLLTSIVVILAAAALYPVPAEAISPTAEQIGMMCGGRLGCEVGKIEEAGKGKEGAPLAIVQLRLAMTPAMIAEPSLACRDMESWEKINGGYEYWLLKGSDEPRKLLELCNDGYGASGVGEDIIKLEDNMLTHIQFGGSAWRWVSTRRIQLDPLFLIEDEECGFHTLTPYSGLTNGMDFRAMQAFSTGFVEEGPGGENPSDDEGTIGCPGLSKDLLPRQQQNGDEIFNARPLIAPFVDVGPASIDTKKTQVQFLADGTLLGSCASHFSTDGYNGYIVYGQSAPEARAAHLKAIVETPSSLLVQVEDPLAAGVETPKSWVHAPHLEIWTNPSSKAESGAPLGDSVQQIGVTLDGNVEAGAGSDHIIPKVTVWEGEGDKGPAKVFRLTWPDPQLLSRGVTLVYSQAEKGKQMRLVANAGIEKNRPLSLPAIAYLQSYAWDSNIPIPTCEVENGKLNILETMQSE